MNLLIGLGNIGSHYDGTRHNIGFYMLDQLARQHGLEWVNKDRFKAQLAEGTINGQKVILAKATTYYNLSGEAARAIKDFYKIDNADILVIHDELDLPFGKLRARIGGTDAGNNGIKSLIDHLGADFARIRIGVANDHRASTDSADFVLNRFTHEEGEALPEITKRALELAHAFIDDNKKFKHTSVRIKE